MIPINHLARFHRNVCMKRNRNEATEGESERRQLESAFACPRGLVPTSYFPRKTLGAPNRGDPPACAQTQPGLVCVAPWSQVLGKHSCHWDFAVGVRVVSPKCVGVNLRSSQPGKEGCRLENMQVMDPLVPRWTTGREPEPASWQP